MLYREFRVGIARRDLTIRCDLRRVHTTVGVFGRSEHALWIGLIVFLAAALFNHINACVTGVLIPFAMKWFGFDPAQSSTIFATTFTDCGGFFATLWLTQHFISRLT